MGIWNDIFGVPEWRKELYKKAPKEFTKEYFRTLRVTTKNVYLFMSIIIIAFTIMYLAALSYATIILTR